jgi:hypothetical protein
MPIASIWPETACESHVRTPDIDAHLTTSDIRNIINLDLRKQTAGGRHQIGMLAGFRSEWVAGFVLECMAGFVGIRTSLDAIGQFAGVSRPLSGDHANLGQMASQPIDQLRALRNQHLARLVAHQSRLVLERAHANKPH